MIILSQANVPAPASPRASGGPPKDILQTRQLATVDRVTDLLDTKFRIPGSNIQFGADFLMGLVPGIGDAMSLGISGLLIATMAKHGASGRLVARMLANVGLDALVGTIPLLGNLFDLYYKANTRNLNLMREYYDQGKHRGSVWPIVMAVVVAMTLIFVTILLAGYFVVRWLWANLS